MYGEDFEKETVSDEILEPITNLMESDFSMSHINLINDSKD
jgi:hypothetical protein